MAMTPDAFSVALVAVVPQRVLPKIREVYFDAVTQLHAAVVIDTPVDTGYLRAGFQATSGEEQPQFLGPRDPNASYASDTIDSIGAMASAAKNLTPLTLGFVAEYAPPVEDNHHMVKNARGQWPFIVERAIANAEGSSGGEG